MVLLRLPMVFYGFITIAVLAHLESHAESTKIPIDMRTMNHWMKRYPTLAEKIELGIDLDKPGRVWVNCTSIQKIRELLEQNMDEIVKQSTSDEAGEDSNEKDDQTVIESRWAAASAEHNLKTLKAQKNCSRFISYAQDPNFSDSSDMKMHENHY